MREGGVASREQYSRGLVGPADRLRKVSGGLPGLISIRCLIGDCPGRARDCSRAAVLQPGQHGRNLAYHQHCRATLVSLLERTEFGNSFFGPDSGT